MEEISMSSGEHVELEMGEELDGEEGWLLAGASSSWNECGCRIE